MKETLREVISGGKTGQILVGAFTTPHIDAFLLPFPKAGCCPPPASVSPFPYPALPCSATQPPMASSSARLTHSGHPPWKDQLLGKEEVWAFSNLQNPLPWTSATTIIFWGGILAAKGVTLGFLHAHRLPSRYPQTTGTRAQNTVSSIPPTARY